MARKVVPHEQTENVSLSADLAERGFFPFRREKITLLQLCCEAFLAKHCAKFSQFGSA